MTTCIGCGKDLTEIEAREGISRLMQSGRSMVPLTDAVETNLGRKPAQLSADAGYEPGLDGSLEFGLVSPSMLPSSGIAPLLFAPLFSVMPH
jgi:hypothetical protein